MAAAPMASSEMGSTMPSTSFPTNFRLGPAHSTRLIRLNERYYGLLQCCEPSCQVAASPQTFSQLLTRQQAQLMCSAPLAAGGL